MGIAFNAGTKNVTQYAISPAPGGTLDIAQTEKDLQEIEALRQQDKRKILWILDTEYQGKSMRIMRYLYRLSDGRVMKIKEGVPGGSKPSEMRSLDLREITQRYRAKEGELLPPTEELVKGRTFVFERRTICTATKKSRGM